jgi:Tfp pilus assembly protein PilO
MTETDANDLVQHAAAAAPFEQYEGDSTTRPRRRVVAVVAALVVVLVVVATLFVTMNDRIDSLDRKVATQSQQIRHLQTQVTVVSSSLSAAVACLQTVGSLEGLCSKLVK